jgi:S1-C subfamily serine protease
MRALLKSHFVSALLGGVVVGGAFVVFGVAGNSHTVTIIDQSPVSSVPAADPAVRLTAHAIYQRDAPGVVFVRAKLLEQVANPFDLFHARESDTSTGSGFLVDRRGDILTNYHVIDGAARSGGVTVEFEYDTIRDASVVAVDPGSDLAVLRVDMHNVAPVHPLALGDSTSVSVGDPTLAIGNPFGVDRTLTTGIVSALQHQIEASDGTTIDNVIQTDQPVAAGNSGGPLLDGEGRVIGINSQVATAPGLDGATQRLAFAIPIDTADTVLARVDREHALKVAYLGVVGRAGHPAPPGAVVRSVDKDGPAATAGIAPGDTITRIGGVPVDSIGDVTGVVSTYSPGQTLAVQVRRGHQSRLLSVVLGSRTVVPPGQ